MIDHGDVLVVSTDPDRSTIEGQPVLLVKLTGWDDLPEAEQKRIMALSPEGLLLYYARRGISPADLERARKTGGVLSVTCAQED